MALLLLVASHLTLDLIEELYDLYLEEEDSPRIVEVVLEGLDLELDLKNGLANLYLEL